MRGIVGKPGDLFTEADINKLKELKAFKPKVGLAMEDGFIPKEPRNDIVVKPAIK